jgi:hypothetical protein
MLEYLHNVVCMHGSMQLDRQMLVHNAAVKAIIVTSLHNVPVLMKATLFSLT